ncbi:NmrA-like family protein [Phyllosticta citrichinensis]|uniref:NmrA-like family protein n=1 Tax=Phyllosticta citrichinensis TaxID=1130410 RepID=A0ABR1XJU9_9PEZI
MPIHPTYLITGATGGLGHAILTTLLASSVPASSITATSTRASAASALSPLGVRFALLDYDDPATLDAAFAGVERLFFVSTNTFDNARRRRQHANVVEAAERARVGWVVYSSLAIGAVGEGEGAGGRQKVEEAHDVRLMGAHLETERLLRGSKLNWTAVREGIYTDAFPVFLSWYPTDPNQTLHLPSDGAASFALREELGEATAKLLMRGGFENRIVALTGPRAVRFSEIVDVINEMTGRQVRIEYVGDEEYVRRNVESDEGGKSKDFYWNWVTLFQAFRDGKMANVSTLMEELLERRPKDGLEGVRGLLEKSKDYTWHQNYARSA